MNLNFIVPSTIVVLGMALLLNEPSSFFLTLWTRGLSSTGIFRSDKYLLREFLPDYYTRIYITNQSASGIAYVS